MPTAYVCCFPSLTDEEDGEGDKEQEDMGNQIESVHKTAIVQHTLLHAVGTGTVIAAKWQGHATVQVLHTSLELICENVQRRNRQIQTHSCLKMLKLVNINCKLMFSHDKLPKFKPLG